MEIGRNNDRIIIEHEGLSPRANLIIPGKWAFSIERNDLDYRWKRARGGGAFRYGKNFPAADGGWADSKSRYAGGCFAMKINQAGFVRRWCFREKDGGGGGQPR